MSRVRYRHVLLWPAYGFAFFIMCLGMLVLLIMVGCYRVVDKIRERRKTDG